MAEILVGLGVGLGVAVAGFILAGRFLTKAMQVLLAAIERSTAAVAFPRYPVSDIPEVSVDTEGAFADLESDWEPS